MSSAEEYFPVVHALQAESWDEVPTVYPDPMAHLAMVHCLQALPAVVNVLPVHAAPHDTSTWVVPATSGLPLSHVGDEWSAHTLWSLALLYLPEMHVAQAESFSDVDPSLYSLPLPQVCTDLAVHCFDSVAPCVVQNVPRGHSKQSDTGSLPPTESRYLPAAHESHDDFPAAD